jgi:hypothetical protein
MAEEGQERHGSSPAWAESSQGSASPNSWTSGDSCHPQEVQIEDCDPSPFNNEAKTDFKKQPT